MPHFLSQYWQALSAPASRVRKHLSKHGSLGPEHDADSGDLSTRAEQLERIAVYAREGYFNLDYTVDAFQSPIETPSH
jgi:hypothetical protein